MSDLVPVLKFVRLPDGRWAMENGEGVEDVTRADVEQMHGVWLLWADLRWQRAEVPGRLRDDAINVDD